MPDRFDHVQRDWYTPEGFLAEARRRGAPIGRGLVYDGVRRGLIPHVRLGRRILIPADALDRMLTAGTAGADDGPQAA